MDTRGRGVSARAHACVALGRCVWPTGLRLAEEMSVWRHAGGLVPVARLPKLHAIPRSHTLFGTIFGFLFQTRGTAPHHSHLRSPQWRLSQRSRPKLHRNTHPDTHPPRPSVSSRVSNWSSPQTLLPYKYLGKGWGSKCTRSRVRCLTVSEDGSAPLGQHKY